MASLGFLRFLIGGIPVLLMTFPARIVSYLVFDAHVPAEWCELPLPPAHLRTEATREAALMFARFFLLLFFLFFRGVHNLPLLAVAFAIILCLGVRRRRVGPFSLVVYCFVKSVKA